MRNRKLIARTGIASIEFAFIAPFLFLFIFGILEIGQVLLISHQMGSAAAEGARTGALPNKTNTDVNTTVATIIGNYTYTTTITVNGQSNDVSTGNTGDQITVLIQLRTENILWVPNLFTGTLSQQATFLKQ